MRSLAIVVGLCAVVSPSLARVQTLSTEEHAINLNLMSMDISLFGLQTISLRDLPIQGTVPVDYSYVMNCAQRYDVDVQALGGSLRLPNVSIPFAGLFLIGSVALLDVTASLYLGPQNFSFEVERPSHIPEMPRALINQSTPGGLVLNGGTLRMTLTGGGLLYSAIIDVAGTNVLEVDLVEDPIEFSFSNLGTTEFWATADVGGTGYNVGFELNMPLTGNSTFELLESLPFSIATTGNLYLGYAYSWCIPEVHSLGLASLSLVGVGGMVAFRRRVRSTRHGSSELSLGA